jgi:hypothetical protein
MFVEPPEKPTPPAAAKSRGFGGHRGKRPLKYLRAMRGEGLLQAAGREAPVSYQLDVYSDGERTIGNGSVDGDFAGLAEGLEGGAARLTLDDGVQLAVTLDNVEDDGADIEIQFPAAGSSSGETSR